MKPGPSGRRKRQPSRFEFITVTADNVAGDETTRRRVRSHAMVDYKRRTTQPKEKQNNTIELDVTPLLDGSLPAGGQEQSMVLFSPSPSSLLDTNRSDPFGTFPISGTHRSRQLWDHMYDGSCPMFRTMSKIGFLDVVRETIALSQMLSASSRHLGLILGSESPDAYGYSIQATNSLQERLADPVACSSDEVISIVLAFACYANLFRDPTLLNIHMNGLDRILDCRGGIRSLDSAPLLRTMVYWVDVNGSYLQDTAPRYPQPFSILAVRSKLNTTCLDQPSHTPEGEFAPGMTISEICDSITQLHQIMRTELSVKDLWADIIFPGFHISPILHVVLSLPRATVYDGIENQMNECFRLAAIIYLTELRGLFSLDTIPGQLYGSKLQLLFQRLEPATYAQAANFYLIWALTVGACASCLDQGTRGWFVEHLFGTTYGALKHWATHWIR
ncbi:hypothetical protein BJY01DRAFT_255674 [Aspergillus pseudoustus]|uniref:Zn(II)2Cys6 transcription factor n=1 Tax=Aspergillus pseudoustus TaxID=1810923 RepID=A0ABR4IIU8_9EURO